MPSSIIESIQDYYGTLSAWSNKPSVLWPGWVALKDPAGAAVTPPVIRVLDVSVGGPTTFEYARIENWQWKWEIYAETRQACISHFDYIMFDGQAPSVRAGFYYPASITLPTGYTFMSLGPVGDWVVNPIPDMVASANAIPLYLLTFQLQLMVNRTAF